MDVKEILFADCVERADFLAGGSAESFFKVGLKGFCRTSSTVTNVVLAVDRPSSTGGMSGIIKSGKRFVEDAGEAA